MSLVGHSQQEHETSHGSMSKTRWAIEDPDAVVELNSRKFGSDDDGAPMMCNLVCQDMGRHAHIDYCRASAEGTCTGPDLQHIRARMNPNADQPKDWITHELFWRRSGRSIPFFDRCRTLMSLSLGFKGMSCCLLVYDVSHPRRSLLSR